MSRRRFRRRRDGQLEMRLYGEEAAVLAQLARDLAEVVEAPPGENPMAERLYPRAYLDPTEESAERQWQDVVHGDLVRNKLDALADIVTRLGAAAAPGGGGDAPLKVVLDADGEAHLLGVLNDARLALGSALAVTDDPDDTGPPPGDPAFALHNVYIWLGGIQDDLLGVLLQELP